MPKSSSHTNKIEFRSSHQETDALAIQIVSLKYLHWQWQILLKLKLLLLKHRLKLHQEKSGKPSIIKKIPRHLDWFVLGEGENTHMKYLSRRQNRMVMSNREKWDIIILKISFLASSAFSCCLYYDFIFMTRLSKTPSLIIMLFFKSYF